MERVTLIRAVKGNEGVFGHWITAGFRAFSLELPWRDNEMYFSCIQSGLYICKATHSKKFRRILYEVLDVHKRSGIRLHTANYAGDVKLGYFSELLGCITLGSAVDAHGPMDDEGKLYRVQWGVFSSRTTIRKFMRYMNNQDFELEIIDNFSSLTYEQAFGKVA